MDKKTNKKTITINGKKVKAEKVKEDHFRYGGMKISELAKMYMQRYKLPEDNAASGNGLKKYYYAILDILKESIRGKTYYDKFKYVQKQKEVEEEYFFEERPATINDFFGSPVKIELRKFERNYFEKFAEYIKNNCQNYDLAQLNKDIETIKQINEREGHPDYVFSNSDELSKTVTDKPINMSIYDEEVKQYAAKFVFSYLLDQIELKTIDKERIREDVAISHTSIESAANSKEKAKILSAKRRLENYDNYLIKT